MNPREGDDRSVGESAEALTPREGEVFDLLLQALGNRQIARRLGITEETVKFHVSNILRKSGAVSRAELLARLVPAAPRPTGEQ